MSLIFQGIAYYGRRPRRTRKPGRQEVCRYELGCGGQAVGYAADKITGRPVAACERHQGL